jgi:hypothetical protein
VVLDGAPENRVVSGVDEHHPHTGIEVSRQQGQRVQQDFVPHVWTGPPRVHDEARIGCHEVTELRRPSWNLLGHRRKVDATAARQNGCSGSRPEPPGLRQVDVSLAVGK